MEASKFAATQLWRDFQARLERMGSLRRTEVVALFKILVGQGERESRVHKPGDPTLIHSAPKRRHR